MRCVAVACLPGPARPRPAPQLILGACDYEALKDLVNPIASAQLGPRAWNQYDHFQFVMPAGVQRFCT